MLETYGVDLRAYAGDLDGDVTTEDVRWLAILAAQLHPRSRVQVAASPALSWSDETWLLRRIEFELANFAYSFSEDAKSGVNAPRPIPSPVDVMQDTAKVEATDLAEIERVLGPRIRR